MSCCSAPTHSLLWAVPRAAPYRWKGKVEIRSQIPRCCGWNSFSAASEQGQVRDTIGDSEREGKGRKRVAWLQEDTKLENNPIFASLTKENEGPEPDC